MRCGNMLAFYLYKFIGSAQLFMIWKKCITLMYFKNLIEDARAVFDIKHICKLQIDLKPRTVPDCRPSLEFIKILNEIKLIVLLYHNSFFNATLWYVLVCTKFNNYLKKYIFCLLLCFSPSCLCCSGAVRSSQHATLHTDFRGKKNGGLSDPLQLHRPAHHCRQHYPRVPTEWPVEWITATLYW